MIRMNPGQGFIEHVGTPLINSAWRQIYKAYPNHRDTLEIFTLPEALTEPEQCAELRDADIIQFHWVSGVVNLAQLSPIYTKKPVVWRFSDLNPFTGGCHYAQECRNYERQCGPCPQLNSSTPRDSSRVNWLLKAQAYSRMRLSCVAPSQWIANLCRKSALLGKHRIEVIPNCVPLDTFRPRPKSCLRQRLGIAPGHKVLLFGAASLANHRKGFSYIIEALLELFKQGRHDFSLLSFGSAPQELRQRVPFPWYILPSLDKDDDIAEAYAAADAFLLTPREENFPSVALESIASGTPVIGFSTGGIPEIVQDGLSGLLCETGDTAALTRNITLLLDMAESDILNLRKQCRERAEHFSETACAKRFERLYETALRETSPQTNAVTELLQDISIISYEDVGSWILGKFARELHAHINILGGRAAIRPDASSPSLISHHIPYLGWNATDCGLIKTMMITHVDTREKIDMIARQLVLADMGICMSEDTVKKLMRFGLPAERLCFIHPAQDGVVHPRKIRLGITSRLYSDGRKRESLLADTLEKLSPDFFKVTIMGAGWDQQIARLRSHGVETEFYPDFDKKQYNKLFSEIDYYVYLGMDEGSMGFLDAAAAGVPSIVTAQGFHLEVSGSPAYSFTSETDFYNILTLLLNEKLHIKQGVAHWTWDSYTKSHLILWKYLLKRRSGSFQARVRDALRQNSCGAKHARKLLLEGSTVPDVWLASAHAIQKTGRTPEAVHILRGYLVKNPDDIATRTQYEEWCSAPYSLSITES